MYEVIKLQKNDQILDVGCGIGATCREMAKFIDKNGKVIGIDKSKILLQEAQRRTEPQYPIEYIETDVEELKFKDEMFSFVHAERIFMHISSPLKGLRQMQRVLKKGGRISVTEPDLTSVQIYPKLNNTGDLIAKKWCSYTESPAVGANLLGYFEELRLKDIQILTYGLTIRDYSLVNKMRNIPKLLNALEGEKYITENEMNDYIQAVKEADKLNQFLFYVTIYTVIGWK
jgi:SAM-dependent methyltransferase